MLGGAHSDNGLRSAGSKITSVLMKAACDLPVGTRHSVCQCFPPHLTVLQQDSFAVSALHAVLPARQDVCISGTATALVAVACTQQVSSVRLFS